MSRRLTTHHSHSQEQLMNQGQHIMAGVRAATQRYYGSERKGQSRQFRRALAAIGRAAEAAARPAKAFCRSWLKINGRRVETRGPLVFSDAEPSR